MPWDSVFQRLLTALHGTTASMIVAFAIMGFGFMAIFGEIEKKWLSHIVRIVFGISLIFGCLTIASWFQ